MDSSRIINISGKGDFQKYVLSSPVGIIVDFHAAWCGPCRKIGDYIHDQMSKSSNWKVAKLDCDDKNNQEIAKEHKVKGIPAIFLYHKGKILDQFTGYNEAKLSEFIKKCQELGVFSGQGIVLGNASTQQPLLTEQQVIKQDLEFEVDSTQPSTQVKVMFQNGQSKEITINLSTKIQKLYDYVLKVAPGSGKQQLLGGYPVKPFGDLEQTIQEAGLEESKIIQKFV